MDKGSLLQFRRSIDFPTLHRDVILWVNLQIWNIVRLSLDKYDDAFFLALEFRPMELTSTKGFPVTRKVWLSAFLKDDDFAVPRETYIVRAVENQVYHPVMRVVRDVISR